MLEKYFWSGIAVFILAGCGQASTIAVTAPAAGTCDPIIVTIDGASSGQATGSAALLVAEVSVGTHTVTVASGKSPNVTQTYDCRFPPSYTDSKSCQVETVSGQTSTLALSMIGANNGMILTCP